MSKAYPVFETHRDSPFVLIVSSQSETQTPIYARCNILFGPLERCLSIWRQNQIKFVGVVKPNSWFVVLESNGNRMKIITEFAEEGWVPAVDAIGRHWYSPMPI